MKKVYLQNALLIIASAIIGYLLYWMVSMRMIDRLYNLDSELKGFFLCLCHVLCVYLLFKLIFRIKIGLVEKIIVNIAYFILMGLMFFDRVYIGTRIVNLNPFDILNSVKEMGILSIILNLFVFMPFYTSIKWIFKRLDSKFIFIVFIIFAVGIEVVQYITMSGIFDIVDIMLYVVGYLIGVNVYKFLF